MKISVRQNKIKKALDIAENIASRSASLPILNNVLLEAEDSFLKVSSTDLETGVTFRLLAKVEKKGKVTVPAQTISNIVSYLPSSSTVEMTVKNNTLHLVSENTETKINGIDAEEFPVIPEVEKSESVDFLARVLKNGVTQVIGVASPSSIKPEISGIYINLTKNQLTFAATDSFRLAEKKTNFSEAFEVSKEYSLILPHKAASFLKTVFEEEKRKVRTYLSPNLVMFETFLEEADEPEMRFVCKLVEGEYPDYEEIIPDDFSTKVIVDRKLFLDHLKRASIFASRINEVKLDFLPSKNKINVFCQNSELGEHSSSLSCEASGEKTSISFNHKFLRDGLSSIDEERVIMGLSKDKRGEDGPALLKPIDDESYIYVVMPIQPA